MSPDDHLPHVIGGNRPGILTPQGSDWYQPKHLRRGRLSEWVCTQIARGKEIPEEWWSQHSGERDDDRVEHAELREDAEAIRTILAIHPMQILDVQVEVRHTNPAMAYQGHVDWVALWQGQTWIIDLKRGAEQPFHALQLALYREAFHHMDGSQKLAPAANIYLPSGKIVPRNDYRDLAEARILAKAWHIKQQRGLL